MLKQYLVFHKWGNQLFAYVWTCWPREKGGRTHLKKKIVLSQAFILEKKKSKSSVTCVILWTSGKGQELLLGTTFSEPNHHAGLCVLCKPHFPDIAVSWLVGPRTEVASKILGLSIAQHCSQCHLHRSPEPSRLEAVPPSVIWKHFLSSLWCHNSGRSLCTPSTLMRYRSKK